MFYIFITSVLFGSLTDGAMQLRESLTLFIVYVTYILAVAAPVIHKKLQGRATGRETTLAGREAAMAKLKAHDTALLADDGMGETELGLGDAEAGQGESKGGEREVREGKARQTRAVSDEGEGGAWVGGNGEGNGGSKRDGSTCSPLQLDAVGAQGGGGSGPDARDEAAGEEDRGVHSPDEGAGDDVERSFGGSTQDGAICSKDPAVVSYAPLHPPSTPATNSVLSFQGSLGVDTPPGSPINHAPSYPASTTSGIVGVVIRCSTRLVAFEAIITTPMHWVFRRTIPFPPQMDEGASSEDEEAAIAAAPEWKIWASFGMSLLYVASRYVALRCEKTAWSSPPITYHLSIQICRPVGQLCTGYGRERQHRPGAL